MSRPPALNYFSFLDLMCCTLGSALLVLVVINYQQQAGAGDPQTFTVKVELLLMGAPNTSPKVTVVPVDEAGADAGGDKDQPIVRQLMNAGERSVYFAAAPGTQARTFRITVKQSGRSQVVGTGTEKHENVRAAFVLARDKIGPLASQLAVVDDVIQQWAFGTEHPMNSQTFHDRLLKSDPELPLPRGQKLSAVIRKRYLGPTDRAEDFRILLYVAARLLEAMDENQPDVTLTADEVFGQGAKPRDEQRDAPVIRALGYLHLRLGASPATTPPAVKWEGNEIAAASPSSEDEAVEAFQRASQGSADGDVVALRLAQNGLLWVATGLIRLTPMHLQVRAAWGSLPPQTVRLSEADGKVHVSADGFEFRVRLEGDRVQFMRYDPSGWIKDLESGQ